MQEIYTSLHPSMRIELSKLSRFPCQQLRYSTPSHKAIFLITTKPRANLPDLCHFHLSLPLLTHLGISQWREYLLMRRLCLTRE